MTNAGALTVNAGGSLVATGLTNLLGGSVVNNGTLHDDLSNAGTVTNKSVYVANVAFNSGTITNAAGAGVTWTGNVNAGANVAGGLITNQATWIGAGANAGGKSTTRPRGQARSSIRRGLSPTREPSPPA